MEKLASLFVITAAALWGFDGIVLRPALYTLPVSLVVFIESALVIILWFPLLIWKRDELSQLDVKDWTAFFFVGLFGGALGTMAITKALFYVHFVNLSVVVLIQKLQPLFAIVLATLFLKERPGKMFYFWAFIAIVGSYLIVFGMQFPNLSTGDKTPVAALFALIAAMSFAASTVISKRALRKTSFYMGTYLRFFITTAIMLVIALSQRSLAHIPDISMKQWGVFLLILFTSGGTAIFIYYYGLKKISASVATICELAFPLTAVILEFLIRKNLMSFWQWIGALILLLAIYRVSGFKVQKKNVQENSHG